MHTEQLKELGILLHNDKKGLKRASEGYGTIDHLISKSGDQAFR
jgi:hypothetical protein